MPIAKVKSRKKEKPAPEESGDAPEPSKGKGLSIQALNLHKSFKGRKVVRGVSFEVFEGQIVGLLGPNGAGKTTSFYMVVGSIRADNGKVLMGDTEITDWPMHVRARRGISYLPQEASVFRKLTVEENILSVLEMLPISERERHDRLHRLLDEFNVNHIAKQKAFTLSGGERRRVEIARALAMSPKFLLLDEPFAGIDPIAVGEIQKMIRVLKDRGIGILITDHNVRETLAICDLGYLLNDGTIFLKGTPEEIAKSSAAKEKYLGDSFKL